MLAVATSQHKSSFHDRVDPRREYQRWYRAVGTETEYLRKLRAIARHIGLLARTFDDNVDELVRSLRSYAELIRPWATAAAGRMLADIRRQDDRFWQKLAGQMHRALREEVQNAPTGEAMAELLRLQVGLITSLPTDAAERVQTASVEAMMGGRRAGELADVIASTGEISRSRAELIAVTEVSRAKSVLTQARAEYVGSEGYIWRTARDAQVRPTHRKLEGTYHTYSDPPVSEANGTRSHPGQIYRCRCYMEIVLPDVI